MSALLRAWAIFVVAVKRLLSQRWLALATTLGLVVAVALITSIPLYADAVYYRVLREELSGERFGSRPPFVFMFRYIGSWTDPIDWEAAQAVDQYLTGSVASDLGLPQEFLVRYLETGDFMLLPQEAFTYGDRDSLTWVSFATVSDLEQHLTILEGRFPSPAETTSDSPIEVLISEALATELGLQVGEPYIAYVDRRLEGGGRQTAMLPVSIAGVWRATDPLEAFWFYDPGALEQSLLVSEETFLGRVSPYIDREINQALWYLGMDGSEVHASDVDPLLYRIASVQQRASAFLPETSLDVSPAPALQAYRRATGVLTLLLYAFGVPIIGLVLAFIGLVVRLTVGRRRNEIAVLRSRGATVAQVIGITVLEGVLLGGIAFAVGLPAGKWVAYAIGRSRSFLDFSLQSGLRVDVTVTTIYFGVAALVLALAAQVVPTISTARHTVVTYKQERARTLRPPWWQRAWLDVLLLIPAVYGTYLLSQQGGISLPGDAVLGNDPFQNPLLFLVPALGILALALLTLRLLPLLMSAIAWIASRVGGVGLLLASRHLSRSPGFYGAPLILLILTLSLSAFTASLAQTLDRHLYDQMYYRVGGDMGLAELGESTAVIMPVQALAAMPVSPTTEEEDKGPKWLFLPVSEHLQIPGVEAAARVARFEATAALSGGTQKGTFVGVDRWDLAGVAFWRDDFAPSSLGVLMNALALKSHGVLVSRDFMQVHGLGVGDAFRIAVRAYEERYPVDVEVVGDFDLFPTWYPSQENEGPLFVGNLDWFYEQIGNQFPYSVWLRTDPDVDYQAVVEGVRGLRLTVQSWAAPILMALDVQRQPQRQGLFGLLSVGFLAAAVLTVLGFLLYAFFSFRRRFIELGILRAVGLSMGQMALFLAWELAFLILTGLVVGTVLGAGVSGLFIPYLQVGTGPEAQIPPFEVEIAWSAVLRIYVLFGSLFLFAWGGLAALLMRIKIFQAVKLGETA